MIKVLIGFGIFAGLSILVTMILRFKEENKQEENNVCYCNKWER